MCSDRHSTSSHVPNNGLLSCKGTSPTTDHPSYIVAKKWDTGILDPGPFSAKIRKVEARLGKLAKIRGHSLNVN